MPARSSVEGAERSGLAPRPSTFKVQAPPLPACAVNALIEPSAVALLAAVRDHFQKLIVGPQKQAAPFGAEESDTESSWLQRVDLSTRRHHTCGALTIRGLSNQQ